MSTENNLNTGTNEGMGTEDGTNRRRTANRVSSSNWKGWMSRIQIKSPKQQVIATNTESQTTEVATSASPVPEALAEPKNDNPTQKALESTPTYLEHLGLEDELRLMVTSTEMPVSLARRYVTHSWLNRIISDVTLRNLFVAEHMGNYVIVRSNGEKIFEAMPIYARVGMHLLFYGSWQTRLLRWNSIRTLLKDESIRQGKIYDSVQPDVVQAQIRSFITTYDIDLSELAQPDLKAYETFNSFFSRRLRIDARLPAAPEDNSIIVSAADCRLTVWPTWSAARKIWVKGRQFTRKNLLKSPALAKALGPNPALAIFRLAPQDYHRFHAPVTGRLESLKHIPGDYYTVNPQAVNERFDVFTANARSVLALKTDIGERKDLTVAIVAVGALLVGSIGWDKKVEETINKGEGLGYFQYGGSTIICMFPTGVTWDEDLLKHSSDGIEVLVKAGERIGQFVP